MYLLSHTILSTLFKTMHLKVRTSILSTVPLKDVAFMCILLTSKLIYSIEQCGYNLVNSSVLHSMLDIYEYSMCSMLTISSMILDLSAYIE